MKRIELLAPARDYACGEAAVDHGADAVYIGGPTLGARAAAGNSMTDIARLAVYAHRYYAKVYLTLNTILFDHELEMARELARQAWDAGVDALIIQDMALVDMDLPPLPLIASTQMHNVDALHIRFLEQAGFQRVILARELSLEQIRDIGRQSSIELEVFVHGSLCVSYSGQCYLSYTLGGRSANRGACGQPCRLPWNIMDGEGRALLQNRHVLSLKDMDRSDYLGDLIDAGVTAFKIEGRLKDMAYVKNITALYRTRLDAILSGRTDITPASSGHTVFFFTPDPAKTFSRGKTNYFLQGSDDACWSPDTPKSTGQEIGAVRQCGFNWLTLLSGTDEIHAGDGLCYFDQEKNLLGLQVVKVVEGRIQVHSELTGLKPGAIIWRNHDHQFLKQLSGKSAVRTIGVHLTFRETSQGFELEACDEDGICTQIERFMPKDPAHKPEAVLETMRKQLSRLGDGQFHLIGLDLQTGPYFLRTAELNQMRRDVMAELEAKRLQTYQRPVRNGMRDHQAVYPEKIMDFHYNIANAAAHEFYLRHGVQALTQALELTRPVPGDILMASKHCLRRCLGACPRQNKPVKLTEPLMIEHDGHRLELKFDCSTCQMFLIKD